MKNIKDSEVSVTRDEFMSSFSSHVKKIEELGICVDSYYLMKPRHKEILSEYLIDSIEKGHCFIPLLGDVKFMHKNIVYSSGSILLLETVGKTTNAKINLIGGCI